MRVLKENKSLKLLVYDEGQLLAIVGGNTLPVVYYTFSITINCPLEG